MDNKHKNETALAIIDKGSLSEKITPPAKKSEIIEAMVQRRKAQIAAEISVATKEVSDASKVFQAAAKTAYEKYTFGRRVSTLAENYSASWYISGCGGVSHPSINVKSRLVLGPKGPLPPKHPVLVREVGNEQFCSASGAYDRHEDLRCLGKSFNRLSCCLQWPQ